MSTARTGLLIAATALSLCSHVTAEFVKKTVEIEIDEKLGHLKYEGNVFVEESKIVECEEHTVESGSGEFFFYMFMSIGLVLLAGLMSGLTVGLMGVDSMNLQILMTSGTEKEQDQARKIQPVIANRHLLLVTLLMTNAAAMEALPLCLDRIVPAYAAIILSVTGVLIFGEIIPQAAMTRYRLAFGASLAPFIRAFMLVLWPMAYPIGKMLDYILGEDHPTIYRRAGLKELMELHSDNKYGNLTLDEVTIIKGTLDMKGKSVKDAMLTKADMFTLTWEGVLDKATMDKIIEVGHSRVPVMDKHGSVRGILIVKTIIHLDPDDKTPIKSVKLKEVDAGGQTLSLCIVVCVCGYVVSTDWY
eukprot:GFYU01020243.1.p1 GENE.GFYU01020243.1~~GFYU01020243.1.p1  ORF type:complete len:359 (+),score=118.67 GFYU01020243.1:96-1172(+)